MGRGYSEVLSRESPFKSAFELFSAELSHFSSCIDLHWTICCRMVYSHLNLVQETAILIEASEFAVYRYVFCGDCFVVSLDVAVFAIIPIRNRLTLAPGPGHHGAIESLSRQKFCFTKIANHGRIINFSNVC